MIILSVFVFLISFLFQGLISNIHNYTIIHLSIFSAIYLLLALVVLQPYFENDKKFIIMLLVFAILFDITYTNTFVLSTCIFIIIFYMMLGSKAPNYDTYGLFLFYFLSAISLHIGLPISENFFSYSVMTLPSLSRASL